MSPESRSRLGMVRPERIAEVCFHVHECFADGEREGTFVPLFHTLALLTLHRFDRLPPHRQSLAAIAGNIAGALARLSGSDERLSGVATAWQFGVRACGQPYEPQRIRQAVQAVTALRTLEPSAFAAGVADYVARVELERRGLPPSVPLLAYRLLQPPPWASLLECGSVYSSLLWNMTALLGTFSPPAAPAVRFTIADCDRRHEAIVRMLATAASRSVPIALAESFNACAKSSLRFDRIVAIADAATEGYLEACWQLLHPGGKALVMIPTAHIERWWNDQLRAAMDSDRLEAIIEWTPQQRNSGWTFVLLRTTAPVHLRRRVLNGTLAGEFSIERIEELCDAITRGDSNYQWLAWKSSSAASLSAAPNDTALSDVLHRWSQRGLDFGNLVIGNNGSLRFDDRIATAAMLGSAVRSSAGLRTHEMRFYYTLHLWWNRIRPLLRQYGRMLWQTAESSLVEHVASVPSLTIPQARSLAINWWLAIEPDLVGAERYGARAVVESIFANVERKLRGVGVKLWRELDHREQHIVAASVPGLYDRVREELRRRVHQRQSELQELDARIAALQRQLAECRTRMAELHARAKAHDVPHDAPELIDSTLPLQNELSELLKHMVVVQSELKMLQQNRAAAATQDSEDWFSPVVARCTAQLLPALQSVRRSLDEESAWSLLVTVWEEHLRSCADALWESFVAEVIADFEQCWRALRSAPANRDSTSLAVAQ